MSEMFKDLVILEMANNHMGDLNHAVNMINEYSKFIKLFPQLKFCMKFQMRDLDTLIHTSHKVNSENKSVQRFTSTKLSLENFDLLNKLCKELGFLTACTPFDEASVQNVIDLNFDILKIASCSNDDYPLFAEIVKHDKPVIMSLGGVDLLTIDNSVSFFVNRHKDIAIMHCVGEYPTLPENLQLNQITFLKNRFNLPTGFSTHESPNDIEAIKIAVSKGADIYEKHIALKTSEYSPNAYSVLPNQLEKWLNALVQSKAYCGLENSRYIPSSKELSDINQFKRGVFLRRNIDLGETITRNDVYYAIPNLCLDGQLSSKHMSKYALITAKENLLADSPLFAESIEYVNIKEKIYDITQTIENFMKGKNILIPTKSYLELSMHYGLDEFYNFGCGIFPLINRDYCKKYIILLPGQTHPEQYHLEKEETFILQSGTLELQLNGVNQHYKTGDIVTINRGVKHQMFTENGCIIEEISTTHFTNDSYYTDEFINTNKNRKFTVNFWAHEYN
jgi:sialic acid synthase SpsE/mannose-6-phosphate isomerase-like protein (cupin superfamily)